MVLIAMTSKANLHDITDMHIYVVLWAKMIEPSIRIILNIIPLLCATVYSVHSQAILIYGGRPAICNQPTQWIAAHVLSFCLQIPYCIILIIYII